MPVNHYFDFHSEGPGGEWLLEPIGPEGLVTGRGANGFLVDPLGGLDDIVDAPPATPAPETPGGESLDALHNPLAHLIHSPHVYPLDPPATTGSAGYPDMGGENPENSAHLIFDYEGQRYAVEAPANEGVVESITLADDAAMSILSDTNGDGRVDYLSSVSFRGGWSAWSAVAGEGSRSGVGDKEGGGSTDGGRADSATPDGGEQPWEPDTWKCVERGEWG